MEIVAELKTKGIAVVISETNIERFAIRESSLINFTDELKVNDK